MTTPFPFVANTILTAAQLNAVTTLPIAAKTANYVLAVGDVGYRVQMSAAGATTITVNTGIFSAGDTIWIQNIGAGTCTITAGTATVGTASSLALAQYGGGTLVFQSASAATFFSQQSATYGTATGGTALPTPPSGYSGMSFTSDGTLTVTKAGLFDVLCFGGGSGGHTNAASTGGGGGSGGIASQTIYLAATTHAVVIGAGSPQGDFAVPTPAGSTSIGTIPNAVTAAGCIGVGYSGGFSYGKIAGGQGSTAVGSTNTVNNSQGFKGGVAVATGAGGGGGTTVAGSNGIATVGGAGGAGYDVSVFIGGSALYKGSGGGGAGSVTGGAAGSSLSNQGGSGGAGGTPSANTGAGGGGGAAGASGGAGGSGILYIRFKV